MVVYSCYTGMYCMAVAGGEKTSDEQKILTTQAMLQRAWAAWEWCAA